MTEADQKEYDWVISQLAAFRVRPDVERYIQQAYNSCDWDWTKCDGCTGVCEVGVPKGSGYKSIPCVLHDFLRNEYVRKGKMSIGECDRLFRYAMEDFGWHGLVSSVRWFAVRWIFWPLWFKWRKAG
jgi:hypothetical protein